MRDVLPWPRIGIEVPLLTTIAWFFSQIKIRHKITSVCSHVRGGASIHVPIFIWWSESKSVHGSVNVSRSVVGGVLVSSVKCGGRVKGLGYWSCGARPKNTRLSVLGYWRLPRVCRVWTRRSGPLLALRGPLRIGPRRIERSWALRLGVLGTEVGLSS